MANTEIDWSNYVSVRNGKVYIRPTSYADWSDASIFTFTEAEAIVEYLKVKMEEVVRTRPEVISLTEDLMEIDQGSESWADVALELYRKGYRKQ